MYIEIPSSLIIYPIPYPSAATGPNPNSLRAGFPQFDVEMIEVLNVAQPGSLKIAGILLRATGRGAGSSGDGLRSPLSSRWRRQ
jgi:hypothetical protein